MASEENEAILHYLRVSLWFIEGYRYAVSGIAFIPPRAAHQRLDLASALLDAD